MHSTTARLMESEDFTLLELSAFGFSSLAGEGKYHQHTGLERTISSPQLWPPLIVKQILWSTLWCPFYRTHKRRCRDTPKQAAGIPKTCCGEPSNRPRESPKCGSQGLGASKTCCGSPSPKLSVEEEGKARKRPIPSLMIKGRHIYQCGMKNLKIERKWSVYVI